MKTLVANINTYLLTLVVAMIGYVLAAIVPAVAYIQGDIHEIKLDIAVVKERLGYTVKRVDKLENLVFSKKSFQSSRYKN